MAFLIFIKLLIEIIPIFLVNLLESTNFNWDNDAILLLLARKEQSK